MAAPIPIPDLTVNQSAQSGAGGGNSVGGATSDWVVSYGGPANVGSGVNVPVPVWVWAAAAVAGLIYLKKRG